MAGGVGLAVDLHGRVQRLVEVDQVGDGVDHHLAGVGDFLAVLRQGDLPAAFAEVVIGTHRGAVLNFVAGALPRFGRQVVKMKVAGGADYRSVGHPVRVAAAPGHIARQFQQFLQHLRLGDEAGRNLELALRDDESLRLNAARRGSAYRQIAGAVHGYYRIAVEHLLSGGLVVAVQHHQMRLGELPLEHRPGPGIEIAGQPAALQPFRGHGGVGAAGKAVQHDVAGVAADGDDALGQGYRLLRGVAGAFPRLRMERGDVIPKLLHRAARHFAQIAFQPGALLGGFGIPDAPLAVQLGHPFPGVAPAHARRGVAPPLVHHIGARVRAGHIAQGVTAPPIPIVMAVESLDVLLVIRHKHPVPGVIVAFDVIEDGVADAPVALGVVVRRGALPDDVAAVAGAAVFAVAEDDVQELEQIGIDGLVAVQIQAAVGFQHPVNFQQPDGHIAQISGNALPGGVAGDFDQLADGIVFIFQAFQPFFVNVVFPRPDVAVAALQPAVGPGEAGRRRLRRAARPPGMEQPPFVFQFVRGEFGAQAVGAESIVLGKGRVDADQVDALVVERAQQFQVVGDVNAPVDAVEPVFRRHLRPRRIRLIPAIVGALAAQPGACTLCPRYHYLPPGVMRRRHHPASFRRPTPHPPGGGFPLARE